MITVITMTTAITTIMVITMITHHHHGHDHDHDHDHVHDEHCGHSHGPTPDQLAGPGGWQRGLGAIFAVGMRPCSGAILVLVFALAQGLFWAGIAATFVMGLGTAITVATIAVVAVSAKGLARRLSAGSEGGGTLIMRGIEFGAAGSCCCSASALLFGYLAAERAMSLGTAITVGPCRGSPYRVTPGPERLSAGRSQSRDHARRSHPGHKPRAAVRSRSAVRLPRRRARDVFVIVHQRISAAFAIPFEGAWRITPAANPPYAMIA